MSYDDQLRNEHIEGSLLDEQDRLDWEQQRNEDHDLTATTPLTTGWVDPDSERWERVQRANLMDDAEFFGRRTYLETVAERAVLKQLRDDRTRFTVHATYSRPDGMSPEEARAELAALGFDTIDIEPEAAA